MGDLSQAARPLWSGLDQGTAPDPTCPRLVNVASGVSKGTQVRVSGRDHLDQSFIAHGA